MNTFFNFQKNPACTLLLTGLLFFYFETKVELEVIQKGEKMTPVRLLKKLSDLNAYSFLKFITMYGY